MFKFSRTQHVYKVAGVDIGGQPGEFPTVLIGSIFYSKHTIVHDPQKGIFDQKKAQIQLQNETEVAALTGSQRIIDPIGESGEALIKYISFCAAHTDAPILVDSPVPEARLEALRHFAGSDIMPRLVYNSIAEDYTERELACLKECAVKTAIVLAFSTTAMRPKDRITLLKKKLLPAAERAGVENLLIDPGVLDIPSVSWAARTIYEVKEEFGFPAGCAPANALFMWEKVRERGTAAFQAAAIAVYSFVQSHGADFIFYGPMRFAPWVYPACAATDAMLAYGGRFSGIRPATNNHPLFKIF
jgi:tetrahydromethanopterin S-methyltransferase subunit H